MAIAVHGASSGSNDGSSPLDVTHSVGGSDRYLFAVFVRNDPFFSRTNSVTWDPSGANESLTSIASANNGSVRVEWFERVGPSTGTDKTLRFAYSGGFGSPSGVAAGGVSYTGVDQTTSRGSFFTASGNTTPVTVNVTDSASGELVIDGPGGNQSNAVTADGSQTEQFNEANVTGPTRAASSTKGGSSGTVTMSWTYTESVFNDWQTGATSLKPASGGTTHLGQVSMTGAATIALAAIMNYAGVLSAAGAGSMQLAGSLILPASMSVTGVAEAALKGGLILPGSLSVTGAAQADITATVVSELLGQVQMIGIAEVASAGRAIFAGQAEAIGEAVLQSLAGVDFAAVLQAIGEGSVNMEPSLTLPGSFSATAEAALQPVGALELGGRGSLTGLAESSFAPTADYEAVASVIGLALMSCSGTIEGPPDLFRWLITLDEIRRNSDSRG